MIRERRINCFGRIKWFESPDQFKEAVQNYAIKNGEAIKCYRISWKKVEGRRAEKCPWRICESWTQGKDVCAFK